MSSRDSENAMSSTRDTPPVVIIIPTYKPPESVVDIVIELTSLGPIIVSDDASPATYDSVLRALTRSATTVLRHDSNRGIGRALNEGFTAAKFAHAPWLLTLDQDSWLSLENARELLRSANHQQQAAQGGLGVLGAGQITLKDGYNLYPTMSRNVQSVPEVIQSGALWSIQALREVGPFKEEFVMDAIDAEACLRLREHGFKVLIDPNVSMFHSLGSARSIHSMGRRMIITHHGRQRLALMRRNRLSLFTREFKQSPANAVRTVRRVLLNESVSGMSALRGRLISRFGRGQR